jgi:hypothetical protein
MRLLLILLLTLNLLQAKKIALLIGNSDYSFAPLANPLNDVDGIYQTLKEIGFDISQRDVLKNASQSKMQKALANFSQRAKDAEIALVYFSGHGMQVNNKNYMFPARTTATKPVDLFGLVDLDYFIQSASSAKYGIILVDACRNNPLVKYFQNGRNKGTGTKGLGQVEPTNGKVVVGFATSAGDTADDGIGKMSPYATALANRLKEKDDIRNVLGKVADDVSKNYEQNPIYNSNLDSSVCLSGNYDKQVNTVKWITPTDDVCKANGGKIDEDDTCMANWNNANNICKKSNGHLPSRQDFREVIVACGGVWNDWTTNPENTSYKSCYKGKGFVGFDMYWSSDSSNPYSAWNVLFPDGVNRNHAKNAFHYVRCIQ